MFRAPTVEICTTKLDFCPHKPLPSPQFLYSTHDGTNRYNPHPTARRAPVQDLPLSTLPSTHTTCPFRQPHPPPPPRPLHRNHPPRRPLPRPFRPKTPRAPPLPLQPLRHRRHRSRALLPLRVAETRISVLSRPIWQPGRGALSAGGTEG